MISRVPGDRETREMVSTFTNIVGEDSVMVNLEYDSDNDECNTETEEDHKRIPPPKLNNSCGDFVLNFSTMGILVFSFLLV